MTGTTNKIEGEETMDSSVVFWSTHNSTSSGRVPRSEREAIARKLRGNVTNPRTRRETVRHHAREIADFHSWTARVRWCGNV